MAAGGGGLPELARPQGSALSPHVYLNWDGASIGTAAPYMTGGPQGKREEERGCFVVDEPGSPSREVVNRAYQEWLEASRDLDRALDDWLEARRASEAAAARYRGVLAQHGPDDPGQAQPHQLEAAA